jgi:hypothetical protein
MARPSLDEIFATQPQQQRPSLDEIFSQSPPPVQQVQPTQQRPSLDEIFAGTPPQQPIASTPDNTEKSFGDIVSDAASVLMKPASAALEVISYFDKPRGALAGAVKAAQDDTSIMGGLSKGWTENTSWKETFNQDWVKENPTTAAIVGFVTDVVADPLWFTAPAKVAKVLKVPEAAGAARKALETTEAGRAMLAKAEDMAGVNRVAEPLNEFRRGRATDMVVGDDVIDPIGAMKKQFGEEANKGTQYIEALERTAPTGNSVMSFDDWARKEYGDTSDFSQSMIDIAKNNYNKYATEAGAVAKYTATDLPDDIGKVYYRGTKPGETKRISTGVNSWDENLFVADNVKSALSYGDSVERVALGKNAKVLIEGTKEYKQVLGKAKHPTPFGEYQDVVTKARALGYDAVEFKNQTDIGTVILSEKNIMRNWDGASSQIIKSLEDGSLASKIKAGTITREQAFDVIRNSGEEIPDWLLQTHQRQARLAQETKIKNLQQDRANTYTEMMDEAKDNLATKIEDLKEARQSGTFAEVSRLKKEIGEARTYLQGLRKYRKDIPTDEKYSRLSTIDEAIINEGKVLESKSYMPEYQFRDQVLASIENPRLREVIQKQLDPFIEYNKKISDKIYDIGRIGDAEYVEFMGGSHLRRSYEKWANSDEFLKDLKKNGSAEEWQRAYADLTKRKADAQGYGQAHKIDSRDFMKRQTLSEETMKKMGIIEDTEYRVMDTINRASKTIREDEYLKRVDGMFGKSEAEAAALSRNLPASRQYVPVPEGKAYGALAGKWVPADVAKQVMGTLGSSPDNINKTLGKMVSWWKVGKLANPASVMRNFYSGLPMATEFGRVPVYALPQDIGRVVAAFKSGGKNNEFIREFRMSGALEGDWAKSDLNNILNGKEKGIKALAKFGMDAFGAPDKFWRAVTYSYWRRQGKSVAEAGQIARSALLDYESAPETINWLSRTGIMPFAKFPYLAGKQTVKALWERPAGVTKYSKPMNQVNSEDREQIMPDYLGAKNLLPIGEQTRIVNGKPQKVQGNIDMDYISPFTSDVRLGNPLTDALVLANTGKNSLGMDVIKPGMTGGEKTQAYAKNVAGGLAPSVVSPWTWEKIYNAAQGNVDSKGRQYDMTQALLQTVGGIKNVPINVDEMFQQKMGSIKREQTDIAARMREIGRDRSLSDAQRKERLADHQRQQKNLAIEARKTREAYEREKKRGGE